MSTDFRKAALWFLAVVFIFPVTAFAQNSEPAKSKRAVATVDGQPILEEELLPGIRPQLQQLRRQEYEMTMRALEPLIVQRLVAEQAKRQGIPTEKFLAQQVDWKVSDPTDAEVEAYYLGQRGTQPLAEVKEQLRAQLKQAKIDKARDQYVQDLRQKEQVTILLHPPKVQVASDPARLRGNPEAPIMIVEFSDFQCPYCRKVEPTIKVLLAKHPEVKLSYRDFPLRDIHPFAQGAAEASRCSEEQGKYWEYHDALFASEKVDHDAQLAIAHTLGLDESKFEACLSSGKYKDQIEKDLQDGTQAGVNGTPGFFVNGIALSGSQPLSAFEKVIADELASTKRNTAAANQTNP